MKPVTFGILGCAKHYDLRVSRPVRDLSLIKRGAVASRSLENARQKASAWDYEKAYGSYEELLQDPEIEAVYIPLPNHMHGKWIKACADVGKAVLCEKPLTLNAAEAVDALNYAGKKGVRVMEAFMYRFHPQWLHARNLIRIGEIGQVHSIQTMFCFNNNDPDNIRNKLETGGGATYDIGCYAASTARFLLDKEPERVVSSMIHDPKDGTDTFCSGMMDFGAAKALFSLSTRMNSQQEVRVYGSGGKICFDVPFNAFPDTPSQLVVENSVRSREVPLPVSDQYGLMFESFARSLREGTEPFINPDDAVNNMKVIDALFKSAKSGNWEKP